MKKYILVLLSALFCLQVTFRDQYHNKIKGIIVQNLCLNDYMVEAWDGTYYDVAANKIIKVRKVPCW